MVGKEEKEQYQEINSNSEENLSNKDQGEEIYNKNILFESFNKDIIEAGEGLIKAVKKSSDKVDKNYPNTQSVQPKTGQSR
jgi:hypothetical protein